MTTTHDPAPTPFAAPDLAPDLSPGRLLAKHELQSLVDELARRPERWADWTAPSASPGGEGERHYECLHRDADIDVWVLSWGPDSDTGWHDHDISSGAVAVVAGELVESNPRIGGDHVQSSVRAGSSFCFGPDHVHRLSAARGRAVSLHAYSPPLWRLGRYTISADGVLRRQSVSYADELRPLES